VNRCQPILRVGRLRPDFVKYRSAPPRYRSRMGAGSHERRRSVFTSPSLADPSMK
jgi:hypothetical protein